MALSIAFAVVNAATFGLLIWRRYWKIYPWFCATIATTAWQATVRIFVPIEDRSAWMHLWVPGEAALLCVTGIAIMESLWRCIEQMAQKQRWLVFVGLIGFSVNLAFAVHVDRDGDWYARFLDHRIWLYLCYAILAFSGFWATFASHHLRPRVARMHMTLYAVLMIAHVSFGSSKFWDWANTNYRWVEMACCVGWLINSGFLEREFEEAQKSLDEFRRRKRESDLRSSSIHPSSLPDGRSVTPTR